MGRPIEVTEEKIKRAEEAARAGVTLRNLYKHARISNETFWRWMREGDQGVEPYCRFSERVNAARAEREVKSVTSVLGEVPADVADAGPEAVDAHLASVKDWQRHAWLLERSFGYRKDVDNDVAPVDGGARTREEAVEQLSKLPADLLEEALKVRRGGE